MTSEQKEQILRLRASFLQEQAHHQTQWRLLCECMKQVCLPTPRFLPTLSFAYRLTLCLLTQ